MKKYLILLSTIFVFSLTGCSDIQEKQNNSNDKYIIETVDVFAMDTYMTFAAAGENSKKALDEAKDIVQKLDSMLSTGDKNSEISVLNDIGTNTVSNETIELIERSKEINNKTSGAFDPTVYPLMKLWGFTTQKYNVPDSNEINDLLNLTDISKVSIDEKNLQVSFADKSMGIDLGGIAKGYTSEKIMEIYKDNNVEGGLVSLGGNVQAMGKKPDGTLWKIAVQNPNKNEGYLGILQLTDKAVITSGGYERFFEQDGKIYHHILDPKTGYPANTDLQSVSIISSDGTLADGYSTSLFVMGLDKAVDFWKNNSSYFDAILYTNDGNIYITKGIEDVFTSDFDYKVIE